MTKGNIFPTDLWPVTSSRVQGNQQAISFIQLSIIWTFFTGFSLRQFGRIKVTVSGASQQSIVLTFRLSVGRSVLRQKCLRWNEWFHREEPDYLRPLSKIKQNRHKSPSTTQLFWRKSGKLSRIGLSYFLQSFPHANAHQIKQFATTTKLDKWFSREFKCVAILEKLRAIHHPELSPHGNKRHQQYFKSSLKHISALLFQH